MGQNDTLLTTKEFASRSGLTVSQVTKMLRDKKIKGRKQAGKWMIPASQLPSTPSPAPPAKKKKASPAKTKKALPAKTKKAAPAKPAAKPGSASTYSVNEFSAMTYLTETGVIKWLKQGRLQGTQTANNEWQIDAASLDLPSIKHLLRS